MTAMNVTAEYPSTLTALLGSSVSQYSKIRLLGRGDVKAVYELRDAASGASFAAKVIPKSILQQPQQLQHLQKELQVYQLLKHRHIVLCRCSCQDEKNVYILMESCTGISLSDIVKYHGSLNEQQAAHVLLQVLSALQYMHQQGVAHHNLKLEHLLLDSSNSIKLCSFSTAAVSGSNCQGGEAQGAVVGDEEREFESGVAHDTRSLGLMLYVMLEGQPAAADADALTSAGPLVFTQQSTLTHQAQDLIQSLLSPNPADRPSLSDLQQHPYLQQYSGSSRSSNDDRWLHGIDLQMVASRKAMDMGSMQQSVNAADAAPPQQQPQSDLDENSSSAAAGQGFVSAYWHVPAASMAASSDGSSSSNVSPAGLSLGGEKEDVEQHFTAIDSMQQHNRDQGPAALRDQHVDLDPGAGPVPSAVTSGPSFTTWRPNSLQGHAHCQQKMPHRQQVAAAKQHQPHLLEQSQAVAIQRLISEAQCMQARQAAALQQHGSSHKGGDAHQRLSTRDCSELTSPTEPLGSASNWKVILGGHGATNITQSVTAQGSGFKAAEGSPINFMPMAPSTSSSSAGSAHSHSAGAGAAGAGAFTVGLTPAVTPVDSPVGHLSVRTKAAAAAAGINSGVKAPVPPQSPRPHGQLPAAVLNSIKAPSPALPRQGHHPAAVCPSPRAGILLKQLSSGTGSSGGSGTGSGSTAGQAAPPRSPGPSPPDSTQPSRQATPRSSGLQQRSPAASSTSCGTDTTAFETAARDPHQRQAGVHVANSVENLVRSRPVYRDISPRLEQCQEQLNRTGSWQLSGQFAGPGATAAQQQHQQQPGPSSISSSKEAAAGTIASGSLVPSFAAVRSAIGDGSTAPARPQVSGGMSPAPPVVPQSPAQQHAAELRSSIPRRASSSNNIVSPSIGPQLTESGWGLNTRHRNAAVQQQHQQPAAGEAPAGGAAGYSGLSVSAPMGDYGPANGWFDPVSPAARSLMMPQQEGLCVVPFFRRTGVSSNEPATEQLKDISMSSDSSVPLAPAHRPRGLLQGTSAAGRSLTRPRSSDRLSSQGVDNIMAVLNSAPSNIPSAAKPPLHHGHQVQQGEHSGSMNAIYRNITTNQQNAQQQEQVVQSGRLRKAQSMDPHQQQQQHPIPPKQTVPISRSPSVAMRTMVASPATTPSRLLLPLHGICSPVAERDPGSSSSGTSDTHRLSRLSTSGLYCSTATPGGTPAVTPPSSGGMPLMPMGEPSSSSGRGSLAHSRLPLPAFHNFVHFSNSSRPDSGSGWLAAADGAQESEDNSPGIRQSLPSLLVPQERSCALSRSVSSGSYLQQQRPGTQVAPHPPSSIHPGLLMSPKAGTALPSVPCPSQVHGHPAVSPLNKPRAIHGQHHAASAASSCSSSSSGVHRMMMSQVDTPTASAAYRSKALPASTAADAEGDQLQQGQSPPILCLAPGGGRRHSAPAAAATVGSVASNPSTPTAAAAAARGGDVAADGRYAVLGFVDAELFDFDQACSGQLLALPALSLPDIAEQDSDGTCNTPNVDWNTGHGNSQQQQQQEDEDNFQHDVQPSRKLSAVHGPLAPSASCGVPQPGQGSGGDGIPTATGASSSNGIRASAAAQAARAAICSRDQSQQPSSCNTAAVSGCPGWPSPVVAAFAHYKGRLGYLMSSGLVGVIFEDSTHMLSHTSDRWVCYHNGTKASPAAAEPVAYFSSSSSRLPCRGSDAERSNPAVLRDQDSTDVHTCNGPQSAAAEAGSGGKGTGSCIAAQLDGSGLDRGLAGLMFKLPELETAPTGDSSSSRVDQDSSSRSHAVDGVPDYLATKVRCLRRFIGCLVHHKPYSSHCQPDITRLPFPVSDPLQQTAQQQHGPLHPGVLHLRSFLYREGCLLLKLTDNSHQLVFTSDNSVLLLDPQCKLLASVTCSKVRRVSKACDTAPGHHQAASGAAAVAAARSCMMAVDLAAPQPIDDKLLAKAVYASKLVKALQLPPHWLQGQTAGAGPRA